MKYKFLEEKILLEELNKIIIEMNAEIYFSFSEPSEQCVCLEKVGDIWQVYNVERGLKFDIKEYELLYGACIKVIDRLAFSLEQSQQFTEKFERTLRME